jgi:hypothetical protein
MPPDNKVLCAHCGQYLTRKREREHRRLANTHTPYASPPPAFTSRLRRVVDSDSNDGDIDDARSAGSDQACGGMIDANTDISGDEEHMQTDGPQTDDLGDHDVDISNNEEGHLENGSGPMPGFTRAELNNHWRRMFETEDNDSGSEPDLDDETPYPRLEDSDDESDDGFIDWAAIEAGSGLSAWDQLGEGYERDAAALGKF